MEYLKFIPEGWNDTNEEMNIDGLRNALNTGEIIQGKVYELDSNFNLHVRFRRKFNWNNTKK